jgi:hypothetical protein
MVLNFLRYIWVKINLNVGLYAKIYRSEEYIFSIKLVSRHQVRDMV